MSKKVLIVDDDQDFLYQLEIMLSKDFEVVKAGGQKEAEELLQDMAPDLAIVDLMMENTDGGFALAYHIKKKDQKIPVIIITAVNSDTGMDFDTTNPDESTWVKADAFLSKPVRYEQLKHEIDLLLEKYNA